MGRITWVVGICSVSLLIGCSSLTNLTAAAKAKSGNQAKSTSSVGSPDISTSKKLKNPSKIHLAYGAWHEQSGNLPEARKSYLKVLEKSPKDVEALLGLARIDRAYDRTEEADKFLKKAMKYHPKDPNVLVAVGQLYASNGEWPEAIEKLKAAQKLAPYDSIYEYHLAVVEARAGEIQPAITHFTHSVGPAEAHYNIGHILSEEGKTAEAEVHLMKALKLKPDLKQAETALASIRSGNANSIQPASFSNKERP